jgi:flagellar hook-basal body complex protein FliE
VIRGVDAYARSGVPAEAAPKRTEKAGFGDVLLDSMKAASSAEAEAEQVSEAMVAGKADIHEAVIAQEKAGIALRFALTLKNRAVEAYREILNTPI